MGSQYIMNFGVGVDSICSNLGYVEDGLYIPSDDCEENLIELLKNLKEENSTQRTYRRQLCFSRVVELDIIPLMKYIRDQPDVFSAAIRFLTTLIQPVECLTLGMPSDITLPWLADVKRMLLGTKKLCTDKELINAIISEMILVIEDHDGEAMSEDNCDFINKCLLLFRNLLYIQEVESHQNQETIILYLLESKIGACINRLVTISQREYWSASIIQLVSLMYTKHTLEIIQPCLSQDDCSDNLSCCDSEDTDFELIQKNCTYPDNDSQNSSSISLTGMFGKALHVAESSAMTEAEEVRPRNGDVEEDMLVVGEQIDKGINNFRQLLLQFTHDFIVEGFGHLAHDLKNILISDMKDCLDDTYFLWTMSFFLKIARRENAPFRVIRLVLTTELFSFLAYEGVILIEQLLIAKKKNNDMTNTARRLHLTISALNELLKTLSKYSSVRNMENCDVEYLTGLQKDLANITDLRMMFILIMRHFQTQEETSPCLLEDLVTTNHSFLELMDTWNRNGWTLTEFDIVEHIKMFGTLNIMNLYGTLLKNFENNSCFVNKCIFTMMHHVAGDCGKLDVLLQLPIIQSLMEVDGSKNHVTREMIDLTEYVLDTFMTVARDNPVLAAVKLYGVTETDSEQGHTSSLSRNGSTDSTGVDDMLFSLCTELQNDDGMVDKMVERFADIGIAVTAQEVWSRLYGNGLITDSEYCSNKALSGVKEECEDECSSDIEDVIEWCVQALKEKNQEENLKWIQTLLCETAYVKLGKQYEKNMYEEPVIMYHVARGSSVPMVFYKEEQKVVLQDNHFKTLLHYMGFHTPQDVDMIFPRIPSFWTSEQLIKQAEKLGPLSSDILKFDPATVKFEDEQFTLPSTKNDIMSNDVDKSVGFPRVKDSNTNIFWLKQIQQYNMSQQLSANFHNE